MRIDLERHCLPACASFSEPLFAKLDGGGYGSGASAQALVPLEEWRGAHRTARKRAARARRLGYSFAPIDRHLFNRDIEDVNRSMTHRQGRPMSAGYRQPVRYSRERWDCDRHRVYPYAVIHDHRTLVAYLWLYRSGELALVSSILGHGDHLENDVMYLLVEGALEAQHELGGVLVYNRHDSGTAGLRFFKERLGFEEERITWA